MNELIFGFWITSPADYVLPDRLSEYSYGPTPGILTPDSSEDDGEDEEETRGNWAGQFSWNESCYRSTHPIPTTLIDQLPTKQISHD